MAKFFQIIFYCACVLVRLTRQQEPDLLVEPLSVTALGRVALIGELYDARRDTFLGLSLLDTRLPNEFVYSTQNRHSDVRYLMLNTLEEKMSILNVKAETKLSLMWGLVQVSGSAKFFSDRKQTSKSVKISLANLVKTEYEQINLSGGTERRFIDLAMLGMIDATHVVVGIQWGGNVFISVEDSNTANRDQQAVQGSLSGKLQFLMNSISVNGSVEMDSEEINEYGKFSFELYGDILPTETPATLVDAVKLMKASSSMLTEGNSGKGKAMSYYLLPIQVFRELLSVETNVNTVLKSIDSVTIHSCIQLFEEMQLVEQKISELMLNRKTFDRYIVKEKLDSIVAMANAYDSYKTTITQRMAIQLKSVRSGSVSAATLLDTLRAARQDELSPNNIDFDKFFSVETEFRFLKLLSVSEATILPKDKPFEEFMSENFNVNIYAFFYTVEYPTLLHRPMSAFMSILEQRETFDPNGIFVAVKLDITGESERNVYFNFSEATRLRVYRNGICVADNYSENSDIEDGGSDPELWSFHYMQTQVSTLLDRSVKAQTEIVELAEESKKYFEKSVPIGFVYVQYPGMSTPSTIWPEFGWQSITANYANGFFRAEGSQSNTFGNSQPDNSPRITSIQVSDDNTWEHQVYTSSGWTSWLGMAGKSGSWRTIRFHANGGEVRPFNYAIRIWKRNS